MSRFPLPPNMNEDYSVGGESLVTNQTSCFTTCSPSGQKEPRQVKFDERTATTMNTWQSPFPVSSPSQQDSSVCHDERTCASSSVDADRSYARRYSVSSQQQSVKYIEDDSSVVSRATAGSRYTSATLYEGDDPRDARLRHLIMFFQAGPLVYTDKFHKLHALEQIDFETEREIIEEVIQEFAGGRIAVAFETATPDRLGRFLATGEGNVLHFSCHGHPDFLFVEDGWAHAQPLFVPELESWIKKGGKKLDLVFVSACYSRSTGNAFIEAGVPHVVCCQNDDHRLHNVAAVEFEKAFYRALACDRNLQEAFDLALEEVAHSPLISREDREEEVKKFVLLPEDVDHNVKIFSANPLSPTSLLLRKKVPIKTSFAPPPNVFIGREVEMYRVIEALKHSRLVRLSGPPGIGSDALTKACCRFIEERGHIFQFNEILWVPTQDEHDISPSLSELYEDFEDAGDRSGLLFRQRGGGECTRRIIRYFCTHKRKSLLVLDAKKILLESGIRKLEIFLQALLAATKYVNVIVLHHSGVQIAPSRMSCAETDIQIPPLDYKSTVMLFGTMSQHVRMRTCGEIGTPTEFVRILVGENEFDSSQPLSRRFADIYQSLGDGVPAFTKIKAGTKGILKDEFMRLLAIARRLEPDLPQIESRAALERLIENLSKEMKDACCVKDFELAQKFAEQIDELDWLRAEFPQLSDLEEMASGVQTDQLVAMQLRRYSEVGELQKELELLEEKIQSERNAILVCGGCLEVKEDGDTAEKEGKNSAGDQIRETRAGLLVRLHALEHELEEAIDGNSFDKAKVIDCEINLVRQRVQSMPDCEALSSTAVELKVRKKEAVTDRRWDDAKALYEELTKIENILNVERMAETELGMNAKAKSDPPGPLGLRSEPHLNDIDPYRRSPHAAQPSNNQLDAAISDQQAKSVANLQRPPPREVVCTTIGAVAIGGDHSRGISDEESVETNKVGEDLPVAEAVASLKGEGAGSHSFTDESARRSTSMDELPSRPVGSAMNLYTMAVASGAREAARAEADGSLLSRGDMLPDEISLESHESAQSPCMSPPDVTPETSAWSRGQLQSAPAIFNTREHDAPSIDAAEVRNSLSRSSPDLATDNIAETPDDQVSRLVKKALQEQLFQNVVTAEKVEVEQGRPVQRGPEVEDTNEPTRRSWRRLFRRRWRLSVNSRPARQPNSTKEGSSR